jgi:hypothetical protein
MHRIVLALALALVAGVAVAQDWGGVATISNTMGVSASRLCLGEGSRGDIGCPAYAPSVTTAGDVSVTGNLSANKFIGDGSGLSGVVAGSSDRIVSGTTQMVAISNTSYISITTGGVTTGYFTPGGVLVANGISTATNQASFTTVYASAPVTISTTGQALEMGNGTNVSTYEYYAKRSFLGYDANAFGGGGGAVVQGASGKGVEFAVNNNTFGLGVAAVITSGSLLGVGTTAPSSTLHIVGVSSTSGGLTLGDPLGVTRMQLYPAFNNSTVLRLGSAGSLLIQNSVGTSFASFYTAGSTLTNVGFGAGLTTPSTTVQVSGTLMTTSWTGINFSNVANVTPTAPLEVSGTVSATRFVGDGSGLTGVVAGSSDRIVSGTTQMVAISNTSYISITTGGVTTGYFTPGGVLVANGISVSTNQASVTSLYSSGMITIDGLVNSTKPTLYLTNSTQDIAWASAQALQFGTWNGTSFTERARFDPSGSLALGMTAPSATLHVSGTFMATSGSIALPAFYVNTSDSFVGLGTVNPQSTLYMLPKASSTSSTIGFAHIATAFGGPFFSARQTGSGYGYGSAMFQAITENPTGSANLFFEGWAGSTLTARIRADGSANFRNSVVAGTTTTYPSATLHVAGNALITSWTGINFSSTGNVTPTAPLEVSGTVSATRFVGDGSGLTGVVAGSSDRIVSGTTQMVAISNTSYISITTGGVTTGYFTPGGVLVANGVSVSTNQLSATTAYFSGNVGIGNTAPNGPLDIQSQSPTILRDSGARQLQIWPANGSINLTSGTALHINRTAAMPLILNSNGSNVGIGTNSNTNPSATLHVSGTFMVTSASLANPALYVDTSNSFVGIGTNTPLATLDVTTTTASMAARFGSGINARNFIINPGAASIDYFTNPSSTATGTMHINRGATGAVLLLNPAGNGTSGNVGIGTTANNTPSATLHVSGTAIINSWTTIGSNSPATDVLQVDITGSTALGITISGTTNPSIRLRKSGGQVATMGLATANGAFLTFAKTNDLNVISNNGNLNLASAAGLGVIIANGNNPIVYVTNTSVGIGIVTPTTALEVSGTVSATNFVGNGSLLTGIVALPAAETISIDYLSDGYESIASNTLYMGYRAGGTVSTGANNLGIGIGALASNTTGTLNLAIGANAMAFNNLGYTNMALGANALYKNTGGALNTGVGYNALYNNANGGMNVAVGANAMTGSNSGASRNTAIGYSSGPSLFPAAVTDTIFIGTYAGVSVTTAKQDTFIGSYAGQTFTTGDNNTLIGYNAAGGLTSGNGNIVIGSSISPYSNTGSNQLNLGNALYGDLGNAATLQAKLGINVTSPTVALEVSGTVSATRFVGDGSGLTGIASGSGDRIVSGSVSAIAEQTSGTVRVSGTLAMVNSGNEPCNAANHYALRINPITQTLQMCRP